MIQRADPRMKFFLEDDETAWLEETAILVAEGRFDEIDAKQLHEYLNDMARRDRREVLRRLVMLLAHMLKWDHSPDCRSGSWQATILHQKGELADLLESRTLRTHAQEVLAKAYERAVKGAAAEMGVDAGAFPATCPWIVEELVAVA